MTDFIPKRDAEFDEWLKNFKNYVSSNFADLGLSQAESDDLGNNYDQWEADYTASNQARAAAGSAVQKKTQTRKSVEKLARNLSSRFQATSSVTNNHKAALNITIRKTTKTPTAIPSTPPIGKVDNGNRLIHVISYFDSGETNSKAKPPGVRGCEIWMKIDGAPPKDPKEFNYVTTDTSSPYEINFDGEDAGKTAHYMLRWVNTRNEAGPWSETISYTISG